MAIRLLICALALVSFNTSAQKRDLHFDHVEPPFWWAGMKHDTVQVLFHNGQRDISLFTVTSNTPSVTIRKVRKVENPHYLFVTLDLTSVKPGDVELTFSDGRRSHAYRYSVKERSADKSRIQGFDASDAIYLIMPDRFANGDSKNDSIPGMFEGVDRSDGNARHGGDLKGIVDHLDYLQQLGITALWLNPVLENNQRRASYHGYAITDLYKVDRRFGSNADYVNLVHRSHSKGLKVIQDMVMNHIGNEHWLVHDLPQKDWIHQFPEFTRSNYRGTVISDPHASQFDIRRMNDGWFDTTMPDVNQQNPLFASYLIQNTLWWIEYAGIDGIRMDTYPYPDKAFMARWCREVLVEYPSFNIVGEVWINDVATTAYWQKDAANSDGYQSFLPSVTDFPLFFALPQALTEKGGWETGLTRLYEILSRDFAYADPSRNVIFGDNHDLSRFYLLCGKDLRRFKMGLAFLLTTRGIPQLYYGTELLMDGDGGHHPNVRLDFPGGWKEDAQNAFTAQGRTADQNEVHAFLTTLLNWRKGSQAIHAGKLTHYIPEDNVYVYFRSAATQVVMVIMNGNTEEKEFDTHRFKESMGAFTSGKDVLTNQDLDSLSRLKVDALSTRIIELR